MSWQGRHYFPGRATAGGGFPAQCQGPGVTSFWPQVPAFAGFRNKVAMVHTDQGVEPKGLWRRRPAGWALLVRCRRYDPFACLPRTPSEDTRMVS
jgi:hypothetical protein